MKFQIEQILSIKSKAYLLTKSLEANVNFKLSDSSFLGDFEIENWFDIPRTLDENGNLRKDTFIFALKKEADREKIKPGEILKLTDLYSTVVEAFYTVSGKMGVIMECGTGMLHIGTVLTNQENRWKIVENNLLIGRQKDTELQKRVKDNFWLLYYLQPIDHSAKPEVGGKLRVTQNGS